MHEEVEGARLVEEGQEGHAARDLSDHVLDLLRDGFLRFSRLLRAVAACSDRFQPRREKGREGGENDESDRRSSRTLNKRGEGRGGGEGGTHCHAWPKLQDHERSTSGFRLEGRHCLHKARSV